MFLIFILGSTANCAPMGSTVETRCLHSYRNSLRKRVSCELFPSRFLFYFSISDVRLVMYAKGLFTERKCVTDPVWWANNPVPKRKDDVGFTPVDFQFASFLFIFHCV